MGRSSLCLLGILLAASVALAQGDGKPKGDDAAKKKPPAQKPPARELVFEDYDKDRDGKLTGDEVKAYLFDRLDVDADGKLTKKDFDSMGEGKQQLLDKVLAMDRDGDGDVTPEEFTVLKGLFNRLDTNHDGALEKEEVAPQALVGIPMPSAGGDAQKEVDAFIARFDKDKDGKVEAAEYTGPQQLFEKVDTDKDGSLDREELLKFMQAMARRSASTGPADFIQRFDKDNDGDVKRPEFPGPDAAFERADTDGDGVITSDDAAR